MKLIVLRHAKSAWDDPLLDDFDRVLNARGRASATAVGAWLRAQGHVPERVVTSAAARTLETVARLGLGDVPVQAERGLYLAPAERLMRSVEGFAEGTVLLVAHNPGIADFAERLCEAEPGHPEFHRYPTAACLVLEFDGAPAFGVGRVVDFTVPRDLI